MLPYVFRGADTPGFFIRGCTLGGRFDLLTPAPDNDAPAGTPYLCVVPVLDAWRVIKALAARNNARHYEAEIEPAILDDVRAGRAMLVFDLSNEGPAYHRDVFADLHRFIARHTLPASRIVWLAQNRAIGTAYRAAMAGQGVAPITFDYYDFFVKYTAWMFAPQSGPPVLGADPDAYIARAFDPARKDRTLLCLNATPRLHRVLTIAGLIEHQLFDGSLVSFPGIDFAKDGGNASEERLLAYLDANPELAYLRHSVMQALALRDLRVDDFTETGNALYDKIDVVPYERSFFSVVTETNFTNGTVDRITEKIVKAFCLGHPALIVGNPYAIRFLTDLGFEDFHGVIDRAYESETNPARRFNMLFEQIVALAQAVRQDPVGWLGRVRDVGTANIRLASSGRLAENCIERLDRPVVERFHQRLLTPLRS